MDENKMKDLLHSGKAFELKESNPQVQEVSFDEMVDLALVAYQEKQAAEKRFNRLKKQVCDVLDERGLTDFESESGVQVKLTESQRSSYDKKRLMELLGEEFTSCVKVSKSSRFTIKKD
jgi:hypothetical protein